HMGPVDGERALDRLSDIGLVVVVRNDDGEDKIVGGHWYPFTRDGLDRTRSGTGRGPWTGAGAGACDTGPCGTGVRRTARAGHMEMRTKMKVVVVALSRFPPVMSQMNSIAAFISCGAADRAIPKQSRATMEIPPRSPYSTSNFAQVGSLT